MGFVDVRQWIALLEKEGELRRITAPVDWDREIGAIARRVLEKKGPALLFEKIRGYERARSTRLFTGGLGSRGRLALGFQTVRVDQDRRPDPRERRTILSSNL